MDISLIGGSASLIQVIDTHKHTYTYTHTLTHMCFSYNVKFEVEYLKVTSSEITISWFVETFGEQDKHSKTE